MKFIKKLTALALSAVACVSAFSLAACYEEEKPLSAYEIAVANGFVGSEQDWLASLKGNSGANGTDLSIEDIYAASGFEGTLEEFIAQYMNELKFPIQEDNDTATIAKNISSVVTVVAGFQKEVSVTDRYNRVTKKTQVAASEGSGVIFKMESNGEYTDAYIITNYHVLFGGPSYTSNADGLSTDVYVYVYGAREMFSTGDVVNGSTADGFLDEGGVMGDSGDGIRATYVGGALDYDIAVLKISDNKYLPKSGATAATFGDSDEVIVGEKAFVVGNANGHGISVTGGIISVATEHIALSMKTIDGTRSINYRVMRTDAAINHGNSGGGLFDAQGKLIGITNAKNIQDETDNMGYALPISQVKRVVENIMDNVSGSTPGYVLRAWLGVETFTQESVAYFEDGQLKIKETFLVNKVYTDDKGGAGAGKFMYMDIFQAMKINDGEWFTLDRAYKLGDGLLDVRKGDVVTFKVLREGVETDVQITFNRNEYFVLYD